MKQTDMMFKRRKLKVNVDMSTVMVSCTGKINAKPNRVTAGRTTEYDQIIKERWR